MRKILFLTGLLLCFFPIISGISERRHQKDAVATYHQKVTHLEKTDLELCLEEAEQYNEMLYQSRGTLENLDIESYQEQLKLAENDVIGSIEIPEIQVKLPIYHGTEKEVLASGVGHLKESSLPVGGENTHSILTGHRGMPNAKLFTRLDELEANDLFFLSVCGRTLAYKVARIEVIEPEDMRILKIEEGKDLVSLVTCTPYGLNTHRLVVTGERVDYKEKERENCKAKIMSWRELLFTVLPFLFVIIAVVKVIRDRRKVHEKSKK